VDNRFFRSGSRLNLFDLVVAKKEDRGQVVGVVARRYRTILSVNGNTKLRHLFCRA